MINRQIGLPIQFHGVTINDYMISNNIWIYIWENYHISRSPESCGYLGMIFLKKKHHSRVRENSEVVTIYPEFMNHSHMMINHWLVGGIPIPLKNMKVSWDYYSQ
jgi:hypothetical protein